ncbi:MAG: M6 family metalloprotease domain-containing protein [Bacteroidales bacterium]|nr:M6 family metalloprotease domain-containing protein [Bacteroidales bacterium]
MSLKGLFTCILAGGITLSSMAVPAKKGMRSFTQPDGTTINVELVGDEFFHTFRTTDGLAVARETDGYFYYVGADRITGVKAHDINDRSDAERAFLAESGATLTADRLASARLESAKIRRASATGPKKASQVPSSGSPRVPVILVQYKDYKFKDADAHATFTSFFTEGNKSAHQYFLDQSNGKYSPQFDVYGPYTLENNRAVYGGNNAWGNDKGVGKMVAEGCQGLNSEIDFSLYDNDDDGQCDVVIVLYAGDGEASSYDDDCENSIWPCQWALSSSDYGKALTLDGTRVDKFAVFNELNTDMSKIDGIGTFCHEFSHCLGLPDFYDTEYSGYFGMGNWSLLDNGSYNDNGYTPIGYTAYEKAFMGWIEIEEATENTFYSMPALNQKNIATDKAIKITNQSDKNEYFIIENRARQGWDKYMPTEGLFIYHVTYNATSWANNTVNNYALQRMTPVPADNDLKMDKTVYWGETYYNINDESLLGDLWPWNGVNEFTDQSQPAAKFNTSGKLAGRPVTEITRNSDGTVSFWVAKAPAPAVATPVLAAHDILSATSATFNWSAADDNEVTYTLEIREHRDINYEQIRSTDFTFKTHGWTVGGYALVGTGGMQIGSSNRTGSVTSPAFTNGSDGKVTVRLTARYYNNDGSSVKVSIVDNSGKYIASETVDLTSEYAEYAVLLSGNAGEKTSVVIETVANKKRIYLKQADIYTGDATELVDRSRAAADSDIRTIAGITATSYTVSDLKENGIYDYRVKAVPVDTDNFSASDWSATATADLSTNGIADIIVDTVQTEYYNLQGIRVSPDDLEPGIYIVKQGTATHKVVVK